MTRKFKFRGFLGSVATLTAILGVAAPANAITFSFNNGDNNKTEITKTVDGLTLTLDDPRAFDQTTSVPFEANSTPPQEFGLKLSRNEPGVSSLPYQFRLTFNQDVRLVSYQVTNTEGNGDAGAFFNLTQGAVSSLNNSVATLGTVPFTNTTSVFQAGTPILFVSGDIPANDPDDTSDLLPGDDEVFFLDNIAVSAVPFEFSPTLGLLAVGGIWGMSRLRKRVTANEVMDKLSA
ncbi:MAG: hypothetical protein QNJ41_26455 [Xenococcaceae cyanobacterium MO_188.B32]|nr:hypothetical protein [Xenococcaceae cyanobacterium MO_188.B32]